MPKRACCLDQDTRCRLIGDKSYVAMNSHVWLGQGATRSRTEKSECTDYNAVHVSRCPPRGKGQRVNMVNVRVFLACVCVCGQQAARPRPSWERRERAVQEWSPIISGAVSCCLALSPVVQSRCVPRSHPYLPSRGLGPPPTGKRWTCLIKLNAI